MEEILVIKYVVDKWVINWRWAGAEGERRRGGGVDWSRVPHV